MLRGLLNLSLCLAGGKKRCQEFSDRQKQQQGVAAEPAKSEKSHGRGKAFDTEESVAAHCAGTIAGDHGGNDTACSAHRRDRERC